MNVPMLDAIIDSRGRGVSHKVIITLYFKPAMLTGYDDGGSEGASESGEYWECAAKVCDMAGGAIDDSLAKGGLMGRTIGKAYDAFKRLYLDKGEYVRAGGGSIRRIRRGAREDLIELTLPCVKFFAKEAVDEEPPKAWWVT